MLNRSVIWRLTCRNYWSKSDLNVSVTDDRAQEWSLHQRYIWECRRKRICNKCQLWGWTWICSFSFFFFLCCCCCCCLYNANNNIHIYGRMIASKETTWKQDSTKAYKACDCGCVGEYTPLLLRQVVTIIDLGRTLSGCLNIWNFCCREVLLLSLVVIKTCIESEHNFL